MKLADVVAKLVTEFGSDSEKTNCDKVTATLVKIVGDRDVPDTVINKVVKAGRQLKRLGIS